MAGSYHLDSSSKLASKFDCFGILLPKLFWPTGIEAEPILLGITNYQINGFFWSKICVIKSQKSLDIKKVNKCNEYR